MIDVIDLIKNRNMVACAKCREPLENEFAQCKNKCYS